MNEDDLKRQTANYFKIRFQKTWKLMVVIVALIAIVFTGMAIFFPNSISVYNKCNEAEEINNMIFSGIISEKKDSNPHSRVRYLVVESESGKEDVLILLHDRSIHKETRKSFFWELMSEGDSVRKEFGTFEISYKKSGRNWKKHELGFDLCK